MRFIRGSIGIISTYAWLLLFPAYAAAQFSAAGDLADKVRAANGTILSLREKVFVVPGSGISASRNLEELIKNRGALFADLIKTDPAMALELALPEKTVGILRSEYPQLKASLETRGRWEGFFEAIAFDDFASGRSRTIQRVRSDEGGVEVYFKDRLIQQPGCGDRVLVEGVSMSDKVAVSSIRVFSDLLPFESCSTTGDQRTVVLMVTFPGVTTPNITAEERGISSSDHPAAALWTDSGERRPMARHPHQAMYSAGIR
jgi:hypothetical protein